MAGEVGFRVAGDVAVAMQHKAQTDLAQAQAAGDQAGIDDALSRLASWGDGGTAKTLLHGVTGAAVAALGGGDALSGAVGAAVSEKAKQAMFDYLLAQGLSPNDPTFKSVMELGSAALGGLVGQQTGASTALAGEQFNRQLHPIELSFIAAKADDYAAYAGISEKEAVQLLINATLDQVDNDAQQRTRSKDAATYQAAANWLANEAANVNLGFVNEKGQSQQAFTATISQFYDSTLFDGPYRGTIFTKLTDKVLGTNWTGTFSISNDKYLSTAADLKLEGQYQEWRATRPADVSKWSDEDLNTMVGFVHKNDLRKMAQLGIFGPPGATWVSLADGDYKTVVNDAAINFATSVVPVGSVGKSLEHTAEAVSDISSEARNADRVAAKYEQQGILDVDVSKAVKGTPEYNVLNNPPPNSHVRLSNGTEFKNNSSGYVEEITFTPSLAKGERDARQAAVGKEGRSTDVGGHIQGCQFDGSCHRFNLFPQDKNFNNSAYKKWENEIKAKLKNGSDVDFVKVRFSRADPKSARPDALTIDYSVNGELMRKTFRNEAGG